MTPNWKPFSWLHVGLHIDFMEPFTKSLKLGIDWLHQNGHHK